MDPLVEVEEKQLVTFALGEDIYAVEIDYVQEIIKMLDITRVPRAPYFIDGVVNLRGSIVPVVDLRKRFGLDRRIDTEDTRIIIINCSSMGSGIVGLIADNVYEVYRVIIDEMQPPPIVRSEINQNFLKGVFQIFDRLVMFLDLETVLGLKNIDNSK